MDKFFKAGNLNPELNAYNKWVILNLKPLYEETDRLAQKFQNKYQLRLKWLSWLSVAAIGIVALQMLFMPEWPKIVFGEFAALIAMLLIARTMERGHLQEQWLRNRYLAERLRAVIFLLPFDRNALMRPTSVRSWVVPRELENEWKLLVGGVDMTTCPEVACDADALRAFVKEFWLDGQHRYHATKREATGNQSRLFERLTSACIYMTLIAALIHALGKGHQTAGAESGIGTVALFLSIVLPSVSAAAYSMLYSLESRKLMVREERITPWLENEINALAEAKTRADLCSRVTSIADAFIHEVAEWYSVSAHKKPHA